MLTCARSCRSSPAPPSRACRRMPMRSRRGALADRKLAHQWRLRRTARARHHLARCGRAAAPAAVRRAPGRRPRRHRRDLPRPAPSRGSAGRGRRRARHRHLPAHALRHLPRLAWPRGAGVALRRAQHHGTDRGRRAAGGPARFRRHAYPPAPRTRGGACRRLCGQRQRESPGGVHHSVPVFDCFHCCLSILGLSRHLDGANALRLAEPLKRASAGLTRTIDGLPSRR
jgi:hypothetical protein